jgi:hypothetical protein
MILFDQQSVTSSASDLTCPWFDPAFLGTGQMTLITGRSAVSFDFLTKLTGAVSVRAFLFPCFPFFRGDRSNSES